MTSMYFGSSASTLTGDKLVNRQNEDLGKIEDLMIDLENGRIAYAVLSFGGFFASPDRAPVLEICYLAGREGPQVEQRDGWTQLGLEIRCVHDVGVGAVGHRGAVEVTIGS